MAEFKLTHTQWDPAQVTPRSLNNLMQTESAHMIMPYWERQMKRVDNPSDGMKFKALDCPYRTFQEANQSIKDKRKKVIRWMYEVCTQSNCELAVHAHAIKLLDRFLSTTPCSERHLQAVAGACILLASKFRETTPLSIRRIALLTRGAATVNMLQDIEIVILLKLHWDISSTTYVEILPFIYDILASNPSTSRVTGLRQEDFRAQISKTISDLAFNCYYHEPDLLTKPASVVAVQCLTVLFSENQLLDVATITRALHSYIPTLRNIDDMQMCWEVAKEVWRHKYRANQTPRLQSQPPPTNQRVPQQSQQPQQPQQQHQAPVEPVLPVVDDVIGQARELGCNLIAGLDVNANAQDSGNYSGE